MGTRVPGPGNLGSGSGPSATLTVRTARALSLSTDQSGAYAIAGSRGRSQLTVDTQVAKVVGGMPNSSAFIAMFAE